MLNSIIYYSTFSFIVFSYFSHVYDLVLNFIPLSTVGYFQYLNCHICLVAQMGGVTWMGYNHYNCSAYNLLLILCHVYINDLSIKFGPFSLLSL